MRKALSFGRLLRFTGRSMRAQMTLVIGDRKADMGNCSRSPAGVSFRRGLMMCANGDAM